MTMIYGIKNCDTVKKARTWLTSHKIDYQFHDFRTDGLNEAQVKTWLSALGLETLINKRSTTWKALDDAAKANLNEQSAVALLVAHPTLIKRPLLVTGKTTRVGFNAKDYQTLFYD